jgi:hypothetical protein
MDKVKGRPPITSTLYEAGEGNVPATLKNVEFVSERLRHKNKKVLLQLDGCGQDVPVSGFQNVKAAEDSTLENHMKICYFGMKLQKLQATLFLKIFLFIHHYQPTFFFHTSTYIWTLRGGLCRKLCNRKSHTKAVGVRCMVQASRKRLDSFNIRKSRFIAEGERVDTSKSKNRVIKNAISKLI